MSQNRQPAGISIGGQFAVSTQSRATVSLDESGSAHTDEQAGQRDRMGLFFDDAPAERVAPTDGSLDSYGQARHGRQLLSQALTLGSGPARGSGDDTQAAYFRGMEYAATAGAASFLNPHEQDKRSHIAIAIQLAVHRGADSNEAYQAAVLADTHDLIDCSGASPETARIQLDEMLRAALITHQEGAPETETADKSPHQWSQVGMRNGFAEVAARWAAPNRGDWTEAGSNISTALVDGITDLDELRRVARGQLTRTEHGDWTDPYESWDDADFAERG